MAVIASLLGLSCQSQRGFAPAPILMLATPQEDVVISPGSLWALHEVAGPTLVLTVLGFTLTDF